MEILEKLKDQGWHLTEDGLKKLPDNNDVKKIISAALDFDFREIAGGALPPELSKKDESFAGNIVLQVQRIRNISAPKANEDSKAAPRFLQIEFSDGVTLMQALELEHVSTLSMNTPPGTKVHFKSKEIPLMQGMIVMRPADLQVLGGKVTALVEKWEMTRSLQKYAKSGRQQTGGSGPPPWIAFGQKLQQTVTADKNFKSLAQAEKEKESGKENDEFNAMRSEAIAEAAKTGARKIFGGGNHQILDHNVKKILEKGYSEEEAKNALRSTGNSLERALYNLKRRNDDYKNRDDFRDKFKTLPMGGNKRNGKENGKRGGKEIELVGAAKPAGNVSLFDFLTDKLPSNTDQTSSLSQSSSSNTTTANAASSFAYQQSSSSSHSYSRPMTKAGSEPASTSTTSKPHFNSSSTSNQSHHNASNSYYERKQQQQQQSNDKSQDSSHRPTKFENNLSSSFATRNSSHPNEDRHNRYANSNRGRGGSGNPFHGRPNQPFEETMDRHRDQKNSSGYGSGCRGGRGGYSGGRGGSANSGGYENRRYNDYHSQKDHRNERQEQQTQQQQQSQSQRNGPEQKTASSASIGKEASTPRYQQQKENSNNYQHNSGNNRNYDSSRQSGYNSSSNNNNNPSHSTTNNNNNNSSNNNNNEHAARVNKLVESTSKMKIEKTRSGPSGRNHQQQQQQQQQHHQQQQQQQQQQNYAPQQQQSKQQQQPPMNASTSQKLQQTFGPLPNGFNYDPSKIIGFQAKETNEFALTLLKSQGVVPTGQPTPPPPQVPSPVAQHQFLSGPPPSAMHMAPQPFTTTPTYVVPQGIAPPTHTPSAFGMIPGDNWNWKNGDRCLAKYWDDGRYYEAEITGISDKTCVVLFLGYGNHEEVLKTDCLPITDSQNRTINFSTSMQQHGPPVSIATSHHQQQQQQQQSSMLSRGVPNRYRGERQVYVPPPKRDN